MLRRSTTALATLGTGTLQALVDNSPYGVVVAESHGHISKQNAAARKLWGGISGEWSDFTAFHPDGRPLDPREWAIGRCLVTHRPTSERQIHIKRFDGTHAVVRCSAIPIPGGAAGFFADCPSAAAPARGEAEEGLRERVRRYAEADEAKTMFLATASHELKTPLTVIQGFAQLLRGARYSSEDEREAALGAIERRAVQLNGIVDRLLLSSRIEAGRLRIESSPIDVAPLLRERASELATATGRRIDVELPAGLPNVYADHDAFITIVDHLLDNATKYSPEGGAVRLSASQDPTAVSIRVTDTGIGMDAETLGRCFDKFWQAEQGDVRAFGGTGIGLFIVQSLVEAMDGTITAQSRKGHGSTFTVTLRRADVRPSSADPDETDRGEPSVIREFMRQIGIPHRG